MRERPLRHALRRHLDGVVDIWVDAFVGDPYLRWIQPDDARWPAFGAAWMRFISDLAFERGHTYVDDGGNAAVAWIPPDLSLVGPEDVARGHAIIATHAGPARADDAVATILAAHGHTLDEPHWTLQYLGVRSGRQGLGWGAHAVAPILEVCDDDGRPCGLVSSNPRNVAFYERLGFAVVGEVSTPDGVAQLRPMHRPAA